MLGIHRQNGAETKHSQKARAQIRTPSLMDISAQQSQESTGIALEGGQRHSASGGSLQDKSSNVCPRT
eukprot:1159052-Pelagomonas_calceolata.AAC.2